MTAERWQRLERLYHAALERDSDQRLAFLREECGDDADLLEEVRSLLAREWTADGVPEGSAAAANGSRSIVCQESQTAPAVSATASAGVSGRSVIALK